MEPLLCLTSPAPAVFDPGRSSGLGPDHPGGGGATDDGRVPDQQRSRYEDVLRSRAGVRPLLICPCLPDSPPRGSAHVPACPDSSTACTSPSVLVGKTAGQSSTAVVPPSLPSLATRPQPSSPSPSPTRPSTGPASSAAQTSAVGQRRKGLGRKVRRNQRARGRPGGPAVPRDADSKLDKEEGMERQAGLEEQMEAELVDNE